MGRKVCFVTIILLILMLIVSLSFFSCQSVSGAKNAKELVTMTYITPRGFIECMEDYAFWVADKYGYFSDEGIQMKMEPGPSDAFACTKFVDQKKADITYPSPAVLAASIDQGMDVIMVYQMMATQVFDFAVKKDSPINSPKELAGKTISVATAGWSTIVDPMLVELGIDPKSVTYVTMGDQWGQAVDQGKADVALTWRGLRAQWDAVGLNLKYFLGEDFSNMPANGMAARKSDLQDPAKAELLGKFLKAMTMGIEFTRINPRAAAQVPYDRFATVREQMTPQLALESMRQLHWSITYSERNLGGYGAFRPESWSDFLKLDFDQGGTTKLLKVETLINDSLIKTANDFDHEKVKKDALGAVLNDTWKDVEVVGEW
jgi:NitT/TauT family transport system substrate-binding protein